MNRFYRIYTFAVLAVFAALPFAESLNADPIWTKRDTPSFTDTDTMSYVNGSFTKCEVFNVDQGLLTLNTHYRYGTNEDPTKATDKSVDTKLCISGSVNNVVTPIMNNGSHIELTYKPSGWQYHKPLLAYSIATANDVPSRTPDDWTIYGSNDGGATWDTLVTVTDAAIPDAYKTMYDFPISTSKAYSLYKMDITGDRGENNIVQMSEISFWTSPTVVPDTTPNFEDNDFGTYVPLKATNYLALKDGASVGPSNSTYTFGDKETIDKLVDRNIPDSSGKTKLCVASQPGTTNIFNNLDSFSVDFATTKAPFKSASATADTLELPNYIIQNTSTNAYAITTANDFFARNPDSWILYGSNDKTNWTVLDELSNANLPATAYQMCTIELPEGTKAYDNYRLTLTSTKSPTQCVQLSEFSVWGDQAVQLKIPTSAIKSATFSYDGTWGYGSAGENEPNLYDGTGKKLCVNSFDPNDLSNKPLVITFEMTDPIAVGSYSFTTANDAKERDPSSWTLFASNDGTTWTQLDDLSDIRLTDNRFYTQNFAVNNEDEYSFYKFEISKLKEVTNVFQLGEITFYGTNLPMDAIPEPSTLCLLGLGLLGMIIWRKRTNK